MKTKFFFFFAALSAALSASSQTLQFEKKYGSAKMDIGFSVCKVSTGGYAVFGYTQNNPETLGDYYVIRTDVNGNMLWSNTYGGVDAESGLAIAETNDGGFILAGTTRTFGAGEGDCWLVKINATGTLLWSETYGGSGDDYIRDLKVTPDGGFIFTGFTDSEGAGGKDIYLVKTDSQGNVQWEETFGGSNNEEGWSVVLTADGGYAVGGWTESYGSGLADFYLIKLNSNGTSVWTKTFGGNLADSGLSLETTSDGGFIFGGTTRSYGAGLGDMWLIKTNNTGDTSWTKTFGGSADDYGRGVGLWAGGYAITGYTKSAGAGLADVYLVLTDDQGNITFEEQYGGAADDEANGLLATNSEILIIGYTESNSAGLEDYYFLKIAKTSSIEEATFTPNFVIYPNPTAGFFQIKSNLDIPIDVSILNTLGKSVWSRTEVPVSELSFDLSNFSSGHYYVVIRNASFEKTFSIIKK